MSKKLSVAVLVGIFALLAFLYGQKNKAETQLLTLLQKQGIKVNSLDFSFLPHPTLTANKVRYLVPESSRLVAFEQVAMEFSGASLLLGDFKISNMRFNDGEIRSEPQSPPVLYLLNFSLKPAALYLNRLEYLLHFFKTKEVLDDGNNQWLYELNLTAKNRSNDNLHFATTFKLLTQGIALKDTNASVDLNELTYSDNKQFTLTADKIYLTTQQSAVENYEFSAENLKLNNENLGRVQGEWLASGVNPQGYLVNLTSSICNYCNSMIDVRSVNPQNSIIRFKTEFFPLETLLGILKLPVLLSGKSDVTAELYLSEEQPTVGDFNLNVLNGKLKGVNLLSLIGQYLPINYDEGKLKNLETGFIQYNAQFRWRGRNLHIDNMLLQTEDLILKGRGYADLQTMKCDAMVNIGVNDAQYKQLTLPIRFFDDCTSPQYKIEINKDFRHQLRNFIKDKFN